MVVQQAASGGQECPDTMFEERECEPLPVCPTYRSGLTPLQCTLRGLFCLCTMVDSFRSGDVFVVTCRIFVVVKEHVHALAMLLNLTDLSHRN